jgi:hypothetical protein
MDTLTLADAARLVLSQIHGSGHPGSVAGLARLQVAMRTLRAAGIDPMNVAALRGLVR